MMKVWILFAIVLILCFNCSEKRIQNNNFSIVLEDDIDKIDLKAGTITRRYVNGPKKVEFVLRKSEIEKLFNLVIEKEVWNIQPGDLSKECQFVMMPSFSTKLKIILDPSSTYRFDFTSNNCSEQISKLVEIVEMLNVFVAERTKGVLEPSDLTFE